MIKKKNDLIHGKTESAAAPDDEKLPVTNELLGLSGQIRACAGEKPQWTLQVSFYTHSCYPQIYISVNPATVLRNARSRTKRLARVR